jgi:proton-dependent oligopeptide transporter, POT family
LGQRLVAGKRHDRVGYFRLTRYPVRGGCSLTSPASGDTAFFGHPKGLGYLAGTEGWERFSFYGMQALLMLYISKHLLTPEVAPGVIGLASFRKVVSALFGPMTDFAFAVQIFGLYGGFILVTPLIGAWLGDRVYGRTRMVTIGVLLMAAGHFAMASEATFLLALLLLILGGGCITGNMKPQISGLYAPEDSRRTRAFVIYQIAINLGALVAPLIIGTLGEKIGFHWGFGAAGIGMLVGLVVYLAGRRHIPPDVGTEREAVPPLTRAQWISIGTLLLVLIPVVFATATAVQAYGIMIIWAETAVDREVFGFEIPVSWIFTIEAIMTIAWLFLCNRLWARWKRQGREPNDLTKHGFGNALVVLSFLFVAVLATMPKVPLLGWFGFYVILTFSFSWYGPPVLSLISRFAPPSVNGVMLSMYSFAAAFGFFLVGYMGRFYEPLGPPLFFLVNAMLPVGGALMLFLFNRPIMRLLETAEREQLASVGEAALDTNSLKADHD